jgi:hypothetical protein
MLWIMLVSYTIGAISSIVLGALGAEKSQRYGGVDIIFGIISLCLIGYVMLS